MNFSSLIKKMAQSAAIGDGKVVAECFAEDGVYHDVFYGAFRGREAIADMIENHFHRDGENFIWDMHDPVSDGNIGYARYVFSYDSKLMEFAGNRSLFEGICIVTLKEGLIDEYKEVANHGTGLVMMGFTPERVSKIFAREAKHLAARDEAVGHIKS